MLDHGWDVTPIQAVELQRELKKLIRIEPFDGQPTLLAGAALSFNKYSPTVFAGIVVLDGRTLQVVDRASYVGPVEFPFIPGLLSFREIPPLLEAWKKLGTKPDVVVVEGQGYAHPQRMGVATHLGLYLDLPTIGCGNSFECGEYVEPDLTAGSYSPIYHHDEFVGAALRTKERASPLFVSPGHRMDTKSALRIITDSHTHYRQPEPARQAHLFVNALRRSTLDLISPSGVVVQLQ